jgi:hypothetical protein
MSLSPTLSLFSKTDILAMTRAFLHKNLLTCYLSLETRKEMQSRWTMELRIMIFSILNSIWAQSSLTEIANSTELSNNSSRI